MGHAKNLSRRFIAAVAALIPLGAATNPPVRDPEPGPQTYVASMLAMWITRSRDRALELGVHPIPDDIRRQLSGYVPDAALDRARWREVDGVSLGFMMETVFQSHPTPAMTLDHVVIFRDREQALTNAALWAHELKHVMQYQEWGIRRFAQRYVADFEAVEFEASEFRWGWLERQRITKEAAVPRP